MKFIAFDSNNLLASASWDRYIRLWNTTSGELIKNLTSHSRVLSLSFDRNNLLASGCTDKTVRLWNTATGELVRTLTGHIALVNSVAFDSNILLASGSDDYTIKLRNCYLIDEMDWKLTIGFIFRIYYCNVSS